MESRWRWALLCVISIAAGGGGCKSSPRAELDRERAAAAAVVAAPPTTPGDAVPWSEIGRSRQQRAIEAVTVGHGSLRVYLIGGIHGDEPEGLAAVPALVDLLSQAPSASAATVRIVRDANPDGTAARRRGNAAGRDLNRNWPAANFTARTAHGSAPLSEPESAAVDRDVRAFAPQLVIVFHSISGGRGPFVNFDGPASQQATAFVEAARVVDPRWRVVPQMGYATPGSLGSYLGVDRGVPILTIEFRRGQDAESVTEAALRGIAAAVAVGPA